MTISISELNIPVISTSPIISYGYGGGATLSQGPSYPIVAENISRPLGVSWSSVNNILVPAGGANRALQPSEYTDYLLARNFGFSVPSDQTISGIEVDVNRYVVFGTAGDSVVRLYYNGNIIGENKARVTGSGPVNWPGVSPQVETYGSSSDTWGLDLTPDIVNSDNFGIVLSAVSSSTGITSLPYVASMIVTVYYADFTGRYKRSEKWTIDMESIAKGFYGYGYGVPSEFQTPNPSIPNSLDYFNVLGVTGSLFGYGVDGTQGSLTLDGSYQFGFGYEFSNAIVGDGTDSIRFKAIVKENGIVQPNVVVLFKASPGVVLSNNTDITDENGEAFTEAIIDATQEIKKEISTAIETNVNQGREFQFTGITLQNEEWTADVFGGTANFAQILVDTSDIQDLYDIGFPEEANTDEGNFNGIDDFKLEISGVTKDILYNDSEIDIFATRKIVSSGKTEIWIKFDNSDTTPKENLLSTDSKELEFLKREIELTEIANYSDGITIDPVIGSSGTYQMFVPQMFMEIIFAQGFPREEGDLESAIEGFNIQISDVTKDVNYNVSKIKMYLSFYNESNKKHAIWFKIEGNNTTPEESLLEGDSKKITFFKESLSLSGQGEIVQQIIYKESKIPLNGYFNIKAIIDKRPELNEGEKKIELTADNVFYENAINILSTSSYSFNHYGYGYGNFV